ncbi:uncharacterized protein LOC119461031 isoform X3 [Dermacentor silvarum]|uniref:uncharacterized protein LOC119461031 isoform X3 n=1 Tax=Dermacentor silvarum TaxID=543639 RepID=UPI002100ECCA|nr:uncharacterized protein LOC119461031 isoform X3 [Dermacentor silvarum]
MIPGNESRNQFPSSEPTHWVSKAPAGSEDVITLTKAQLQKLLRALEAQEPSDTIATASVPTITSALNKLPISGDDCLPNWVKRNSTALRGTQHSNESSLAGFPQRLSNSHPELGTGSSRPFSKLAQKQRQWEKEKAEMQDWNPWGRPGGGAPRFQPVAAVPPRTDTQPAYDVPEDEKDEAKRRWIQELEHQREENQRRSLENRHATLSNGSCWADSESLGSEKLVRPGEDCSESVWSITRGQGYRPGTDAKMLANDEKRMRAMEYQRAIQAQMQEKQERLRAEREARIREEREQERRVEEERRKLELEYQEEQRKVREKKEREEKARLQLIAKMQQAAEEAEALRKARRSQRFHHMSQPDQAAQQLPSFDSGGSIDADFSTSLERISSSMAGISNIASEEQTDLSTQQNLSSVQMSSQTALPMPQLQASMPATLAPAATVRPLRGDHDVAASNKVQREMSSQTDGSLSTSICSSRCSLLSSAGMVEMNPYIENRVLTPTKVRIAQHAMRSQQQRSREFGIQTDISLPCGWNHSVLCDNTTQLAQEFETRSCLREFPPYTSAVRRLQHSLPLKGVHRKPSAYGPPENLHEPAAAQRTPLTVNKGRVSSVLPVAIARSSAQKLQELRKQHCERESGARRLHAVSQFSSQVVGRGGIAERNSRSRAPVRVTGQVPLHFEEALQNTTQSEEEDGTIHGSAGHRPAQSPPVPALRDKLLPSPHRSMKNNVSNSPNISSEVPVTPGKAPVTPGKATETPPASRKRWRRQEVYVPQQPFGEAQSPKHSTPNRRRVGNTPTQNLQLQGIVERQRSVSVSGARRNQSPSPDRRAQRSSSQDPLVHPELVTSCPTRRQDKILQQLFTLRQGLLIKQREMESHLVKVNQ